MVVCIHILSILTLSLLSLIPLVLGAGTSPRPFIILEQLKEMGQIMDLSEESMRPSVMRKRAFHYPDLLRHARAFAAGMNYLHEEADAVGMILHRDLKPENIGDEDPFLSLHQPYPASYVLIMT